MEKIIQGIAFLIFVILIRFGVGYLIKNKQEKEESVNDLKIRFFYKYSLVLIAVAILRIVYDIFKLNTNN